jgi:hypothetical protein
MVDERRCYRWEAWKKSEGVGQRALVLQNQCRLIPVAAGTWSDQIHWQQQQQVQTLRLEPAALAAPNSSSSVQQ